MNANGMPSGHTWHAHLRLLRRMSRQFELTGHRNLDPGNAFAACVAIALSVATFIHGKRLE